MPTNAENDTHFSGVLPCDGFVGHFVAVRIQKQQRAIHNVPGQPFIGHYKAAPCCDVVTDAMTTECVDSKLSKDFAAGTWLRGH